LQYKNKKNLYKIVFITILLGFIISLAGCNWLSLGLLNIFDPQAQIRVDFNPEEGGSAEEGCFNIAVYCLNEVEFFIEGFAYNYHGYKYNSGEIDIPDLSRTIEVSFYVSPSTSPGSPGDKTIIKNIPLYYQDVSNYLTENPLITQITSDINLFGKDGAGHNLTIKVASDLVILDPGVDYTSPNADIDVSPGTTGTAPFTVVFDASGSYDNEPGDALIRIASYSWDFGDNTSGTGVLTTHTFSNPGIYIVILTVTDYYGNEGYDTVTITVEEPEEGEGCPG